MHEIVHITAPSYLTEMIPDKVGANGIKQFQTRTERFKSSFISDLIKKWSALSEDIKQIIDVDEFKMEFECRISFVLFW